MTDSSGLAVGQARLRLTVVSSLTADELDPERTTSDGARAVLRRLLQVLPTEHRGSHALGVPPAGDPYWTDSSRRCAPRARGRHRAAGGRRPTRRIPPEPTTSWTWTSGRRRCGAVDQVDLPGGGRRDGWQPDAATHPDLLVRVAGSTRPVGVLWDGRPTSRRAGGRRGRRPDADSRRSNGSAGVSPGPRQRHRLRRGHGRGSGRRAVPLTRPLPAAVTATPGA